MAGSVRLKRVYDPRGRSDGRRFLVERLWPRGIKKEALSLTAWQRDVAPSHELRKWFGHDPAKWQEFSRRYRAELDARPEAWQPLLDAAREGDITLLFSTHDSVHNNAVILQDVLRERMATRGRRRG